MDPVDYVSPEWAHSALILIDVQHDFVDGAAVIDGTAERLAAMTRIAAEFRAAKRPIVHVVRLYQPGGSDVDNVRRAAVEAGARIAAPDTHGAQIQSTLLTRPVELDCPALLSGQMQPVGTNEVILYKPRWSAFYRTSLDAHLQDLGVSTVVVAGCNLPNCPRATLFDASERDYRAVLITDATSQTNPQRLDDLASIGVNLLDTDQACREVAQTRV
ncbi:cysteine hydrolase family protein [Mycolicibacterium nivoides]|uniref:cysteine hydrolase family protein n=1 Tax=Mycolicibacterium nivoides TaxID=2487344 RepID=UPI000F5BA55A|nr:isochorismatase family cysteine hydrolase [Mycolicibacterium nivoides]